MSVLYRDYRPQTFSEVLGQNHVKITLRNEVAAGRLAQAYLFCGPRAVGKTTLARVLAKAVNCEKRKDGEYEPCNKCPSCESITLGRNLDVVEIDAASNTGVDNVRENVIAFSRLAPSGAKFKVFIIDEVHMLSLSAFNALLKIIEEPPAYVIFILCTTEIQKVPNTVISRCERFDFKRISVKEIVEKLSYIAGKEKITIDKEVLEAVARKSGGHLRDAESLLGQIFSLGDKRITAEQAELIIPHYNSNEAVDLLGCLSRKDAAKAVAIVNNLADSGVNLKIFAGEIIGLLREIMLNKLSPELADTLGLDLGDSLEKKLITVADNLNWEQLLSFTRGFLEAANESKGALIPQLPLELAITELCFGPAHSASTAFPASARPVSFKPSESRSSASLMKNGSQTETFKKNEPIKEEEPLKKERLSGEDEKKATGEAVGNLSSEELSAKWPEFLVKIKKHNHSLSFVMQNCEPRLDADGLGLIFKYKFHQDRINDVNIKNIVAGVLAEVFGGPLNFHSLIDENLELKKEKAVSSPAPASPSATPKAASSASAAPAHEPAGGLVSDLLKTFGGEVID